MNLLCFFSTVTVDKPCFQSYLNKPQKTLSFFSTVGVDQSSFQNQQKPVRCNASYELSELITVAFKTTQKKSRCYASHCSPKSYFKKEGGCGCLSTVEADNNSFQSFLKKMKMLCFLPTVGVDHPFFQIYLKSGKHVPCFPLSIRFVNRNFQS